MKMAAAAGNGDEQVRIEGSTANDPADGIDSFSLRVTNFFLPVFCACSWVQNLQAPKGATMDGVQGSLS